LNEASKCKKANSIKRNMFVVGNVNTGKSSLINAVIQYVDKKLADKKESVHGSV
jgi:ribosome biogenesis GTPase A